MKLLFAIDGSDCSEEVIKAGLGMNCEASIELKVVTVCQLLEPLAVLPGVKEKELEAARELVDDAVKRLSRIHPKAVITGDVLEGYAVDEIITASEKWRADLILLGTHGRTGISEFILGSVARSVLLHALCAVRVVRSPSTPWAHSGLSHVVLALDDSEHSKHVVDHALACPWPSDTKFRCIHVVREAENDLVFDPDMWFSKTIAQQRQDMVLAHRNWVESAAKRINDALGEGKATAEVLTGDPRSVIMQVAEQWPADLILLGSHGRTGIEKLIIGSVSEAVAGHARCSVEIARVPAFRHKKMHVII